ncbi:hypothetical protein [Flavobacterium litorale]|uniref:Outer membrane protein beta-barrel domain-containing protein n=1 Tax=Flavobacterium litorale TaxID=2856519 RepID=A0ABX8VFA9_9FLAO|nr:hypothetical protein [Flavobacterium litorale]QYJ69296.1 hypothetical protein K1I41_05245 [Flavobacterium litorale]
MKKTLLFVVVCVIGIPFMSLAQETTYSDTNDDDKVLNWYFAAGVAVTNDYKINENLAAAGMPELNNVMPEITFGYMVKGTKLLMDFEINTAFMDERTSTDRIQSVAFGFKLRGHYIPYSTENFFLSGGVDLSYLNNRFNLYSRGNVIDLNDLNPSTHTGHISLYNEQFYVGPSIAFGAFQKSSFPIRLNVGYEFSAINGKWRSDFANVANDFREDVQGRFYAKLALLF